MPQVPTGGSQPGHVGSLSPSSHLASASRSESLLFLVSKDLDEVARGESASQLHLPCTEPHDILALLMTAFVQSLSSVQLCNPVDCSMPGFPVLPHLPKFAQTRPLSW